MLSGRSSETRVPRSPFGSETRKLAAQLRDLLVKILLRPQTAIAGIGIDPEIADHQRRHGIEASAVRNDGTACGRPSRPMPRRVKAALMRGIALRRRPPRYYSLGNQRNALSAARPAYFACVAQLLLDAQELVVFRGAVGARERAGLDLPAIGGDREVGDGGVFGLARSGATSPRCSRPCAPSRRRPAFRSACRSG